MPDSHKPEPITNTAGRIVSMFCRHCGRAINVFTERPFTEEEVRAAGRYGSVSTYRHNPGRGYPHPRRSKG